MSENMDNGSLTLSDEIMLHDVAKDCVQVGHVSREDMDKFAALYVDVHNHQTSYSQSNSLYQCAEKAQKQETSLFEREVVPLEGFVKDLQPCDDLQG